MPSTAFIRRRCKRSDDVPGGCIAGEAQVDFAMSCVRQAVRLSCSSRYQSLLRAD